MRKVIAFSGVAAILLLAAAIFISPSPSRHPVNVVKDLLYGQPKAGDYAIAKELVALLNAQRVWPDGEFTRPSFNVRVPQRRLLHKPLEVHVIGLTETEEQDALVSPLRQWRKEKGLEPFALLFYVDDGSPSPTRKVRIANGDR